MIKHKVNLCDQQWEKEQGDNQRREKQSDSLIGDTS